MIIFYVCCTLFVCLVFHNNNYYSNMFIHKKQWCLSGEEGIMNSFQNMVNFFLLLSTVILTVIAVVWVRVIFSGLSKPHGTQQNSLFIFCLQSVCHIDRSGELGSIFLECCITYCIIFLVCLIITEIKHK